MLDAKLMANRRIAGATVAFVAAALLVLWPEMALSQNSLGIGGGEQAIRPEPGFIGSVLFWIQQQQSAFYKALTTTLQQLKTDPSAAWTMATLSFGYGVFHAAGPGHGKAIISSYMIANEVAARRGIALSFISAFLQGIVAIVLMGALIFFLRGLGVKTGEATGFLEIASYTLVTLLGAYLLYSKVFGKGHHHHHHHAHDHGAEHKHSHERAHDHAAIGEPALALVGAGDHSHAHHHDHDHSHGHHGHDHGHSHDHLHAGEVCSTCGHSHAPDPQMLEGDQFSWKQAASAVLAVGIRPCTGAIIVLTFAFLNGLYMAGILSALAMSVGTGLTVATLALMAVGAKDLAIRYAKTEKATARIYKAIEIIGAGMVFLLGATLLSAALWG